MCIVWCSSVMYRLCGCDALSVCDVAVVCPWCVCVCGALSVMCVCVALSVMYVCVMFFIRDV